MRLTIDIRQSRQRRRRLAVLVGAMLMPALSCTSGPGETRVVSADSSSGAVIEQPRPQDQLRRFLELTIATRGRRTPAQFDSVYACRDREDFDEGRWGADFKILEVTPKSDSVVEGRVVLTTVARARQGSGTSYNGQLGVREDTAHFRLTKSPETRHIWKVCGDARERFQPFPIGREVIWQPPGSSSRRPLELIDSVRTARGLPILR